MKFLIDFFPVLAFFVAYYISQDLPEKFYIATGVMIIATLIQVSVTWLLYRRFEKMHMVTLVIVLVLGGLTLLLQDKRFVMWKPTAVNWLFALAFLISEFVGSKPLIQRMMDHAMTVPARVWYVLNRCWIAFFVFSGALNLYVAYNFAENVWVNFKLFGLLGLTLLFAIAQAFYLARYITDPGKGSGEN